MENKQNTNNHHHEKNEGGNESAKSRKTENSFPTRKLIKWLLILTILGLIIWGLVVLFSNPYTSVNASTYWNGEVEMKGKIHKIEESNKYITVYGKDVKNRQVSFRLFITSKDTGVLQGTSNITLVGSEPVLPSDTFKSWWEGEGLNGKEPISITYPGNSWGTLFSILQFLPILLIIFLFLYIYFRARRMASSDSEGGGGGLFDPTMGMGKSLAKPAKTNIKFTDVAGIEEEKNELIEIVDYLKRPAKYASMGARTPKGVMLYGPPGTGKTLLAKAVAGEAGVPFLQVAGSAFEDMLVGVGAKRVRDMFTRAKKAAPCIIFIDEIDTIGAKRGRNEMLGGAGIADQTINQLLAELDGFETTSGVVVMAATNRLDVLDEALLRPGRFDRHIPISLPNIKERAEILKLHARNKNISSKVNLEDIARRTPGFSGAQLENVLNEATLIAVRNNKNVISMEDIDEGIDRTIGGPAKKSRVITAKEKEQLAFHEAGHAVVGMYSPGADVVQKITIIQRGSAGGYTLMTPEKQDIYIQTKTDILANIASLMGGRASEALRYGEENISTGIANDLFKVSNYARAMVEKLGMSSIGINQLAPSEGSANPYQKTFSEATYAKIDVEVEKIVQQQYKVATQIISEHMDEVMLIVETLLLIETIVKPQIDYIHEHKKLPAEAQAKKDELIAEGKTDDLPDFVKNGNAKSTSKTKKLDLSSTPTKTTKISTTSRISKTKKFTQE